MAAGPRAAIQHTVPGWMVAAAVPRIEGHMYHQLRPHVGAGDRTASQDALVDACAGPLAQIMMCACGTKSGMKTKSFTPTAPSSQSPPLLVPLSETSLENFTCFGQCGHDFWAELHMGTLP